MPDWGIKEFKKAFFDAEFVKDKVSKEVRKGLSGMGAITRTVMKQSIKYSDVKSAVGMPPSAHRGRKFTRLKKNRKTGEKTPQAASPLRELIFFAYDPSTESVVIGPAKFGNTGAPHRLEKGGGGQFTTASGKKKSGYWRPRPFAKPAGDKAAREKKFQMFKSSF